MFAQSSWNSERCEFFSLSTPVLLIRTDAGWEAGVVLCKFMCLPNTFAPFISPKLLWYPDSIFRETCRRIGVVCTVLSFWICLSHITISFQQVWFTHQYGYVKLSRLWILPNKNPRSPFISRSRQVLESLNNCFWIDFLVVIDIYSQCKNWEDLY